MNNSASIFLVNDQVRAVACVFNNDANAKHYVYKSTDMTIQVGDFLAVEGFANDKPFNMAIVKVVEVDVDVEYSNAIQYKWVVSKIDIKNFEQVQAAEKAMIAQIKQCERTHRKAALRKVMQDNGVDFSNITANVPFITDGSIKPLAERIEAAPKVADYATPVPPAHDFIKHEYDIATNNDKSETITEFKVGQVWANNAGERIKIRKIRASGGAVPLSYPIEDENGVTYTMTGRLYETSTSEDDLVKLIEDVA